MTRRAALRRRKHVPRAAARSSHGARTTPPRRRAKATARGEALLARRYAHYTGVSRDKIASAQTEKGTVPRVCVRGRGNLLRNESGMLRRCPRAAPAASRASCPTQLPPVSEGASLRAACSAIGALRRGGCRGSGKQGGAERTAGKQRRLRTCAGFAWAEAPCVRATGVAHISPAPRAPLKRERGCGGKEGEARAAGGCTCFGGPTRASTRGMGRRRRSVCQTPDPHFATSRHARRRTHRRAVEAVAHTRTHARRHQHTSLPLGLRAALGRAAARDHQALDLAQQLRQHCRSPAQPRAATAQRAQAL